MGWGLCSFLIGMGPAVDERSASMITKTPFRNVEKALAIISSNVPEVKLSILKAGDCGILSGQR